MEYGREFEEEERKMEESGINTMMNVGNDSEPS